MRPPFTSYERIDEIPTWRQEDGSRERSSGQNCLGLLKRAKKVRSRRVARGGRRPRGVGAADKPTGNEHRRGRAFVRTSSDARQGRLCAFRLGHRHFRDIGEFMTELKDLLNAKE